MRLKHRGVVFALGLAATLAAVTLGGPPAAAAHSAPASAVSAPVGRTSQATWQAAGLSEDGQTICTRPTVGQRSLVLIRLIGTWPQLESGAQNLPAGSSYETYPIYPGSNDSPTHLRSAVNVLLPALPMGTEGTAEIWLSDGVHTQTFPFNIVVTPDCTGFRL
ncbi:DUF5980 family protein [Solwaraspora sp. WMMB335]|uniref:DUF5980 family protein n=1 Tax=Solwaraspora sp. WMMB335 TaxID=3404118 RepID=UPI003B937F6E